MPARSVCLLALSLSEAGPGRFGRQVSVTGIYHTIPYHTPSRSRPLVRLHRPLPYHTIPRISMVDQLRANAMPSARVPVPPITWDGMVWYGMVWYGMVWYGMHYYHDGHGYPMQVSVTDIYHTIPYHADC